MLFDIVQRIQELQEMFFGRVTILLMLLNLWNGLVFFIDNKFYYFQIILDILNF